VIIHLVYPDGPVLTAACGHEIDGIKHTGQYASSIAQDLAWGRDVCQACVHLLETP
jgi:hypothetical protein